MNKVHLLSNITIAIKSHIISIQINIRINAYKEKNRAQIKKKTAKD